MERMTVLAMSAGEWNLGRAAMMLMEKAGVVAQRRRGKVSRMRTNRFGVQAVDR
jgi:hypothetical protein